MSQVTTSQEMSRKQHRPCNRHRVKTRITRKSANQSKLHNFDLSGGMKCRPTLSFCYAVIEKLEPNSTLNLLVLADSNSTQRMLQMVGRNYPPTDFAVAEDITTTDSNYTFNGLKLHVGNGAHVMT